MFITDKFLIGGKYYDERTKNNIGILNIFSTDDDIFFDTTISQLTKFPRKPRHNSYHEHILNKYMEDKINQKENYIEISNMKFPSEDLFDSRRNWRFMKDQVNTIFPLNDGKHTLIG